MAELIEMPFGYWFVLAQGIMYYAGDTCTVKNLVQETCASFLYKKLASNFDASFLLKKRTDHKKATANNTNNKMTNRQKSTNKPTNHISQFWSRVYKFLASNRPTALFYKKAWHTVTFLVQVDLYTFLVPVQDSWLCVTGIKWKSSSPLGKGTFDQCPAIKNHCKA